MSDFNVAKMYIQVKLKTKRYRRISSINPARIIRFIKANQILNGVLRCVYQNGNENITENLDKKDLLDAYYAFIGK
jgi:hypothetical protein